MHPGYVPDKVISDAELVVLAREGEAGAFGMLVERHRAALYAAALAVLGDRDAAMDAVQEAFMVALTHLNSIRDPAAVGRWLRMVARNCALMQIRRVRHEIVGGNLEAWARTPGPEQVLEEHALRDWVWAAIEALAEEERITLVLRHFTRCRTYEAIAAITGVPVGTVRSRLSRARRRLAADLAARAGGRQRDQGDLEESRGHEWKSFYNRLHDAPEPRTYRDLYRSDVVVQDVNGTWRGLDSWSAEERQAIDIGVRADITGLAAGRDLTILEIDFRNPPWAAAHCPPSSTFVHRLDRGRSASVDIYYHAS